MILNELYNITGEFNQYNVLIINVPANSGIKEVHFPLECTNWAPSIATTISYLNLDNMPRIFYETTNMYRVFCMNNTGGTGILGSPQCGPNVVNMAQAYQSCYKISGDARCGANVTNMYQTYYFCNNLNGCAASSDNVINMHTTYGWCFNLTGSPRSGLKVTDMTQTYTYCYNITGDAACGSNVTSMTQTYKECYNLNGIPVCGPNVTSMYEAYCDCYNLTGSPAIGSNVTQLGRAYYQCQKLNGKVVIPSNVTNINQAFWNCNNLEENAFVQTQKITSYATARNAFRNTSVKNIYTLSKTTATYIMGGGYWVTFQEQTANNRYYNAGYGISIYWNWNGVVW